MPPKMPGSKIVIGAHRSLIASEPERESQFYNEKRSMKKKTAKPCRMQMVDELYRLVRII